jgi:hypothetical protein
MSRPTRGVLYGVAAVLALDTAGSVASQAFGFDYATLTPVSIVIYAAIGAYVGTTEPVSRAAIAGAVVGLVDATLGWAISWAIGPGRPLAEERITPLGLFNTAVFVAVLGAVAASVGAWVVHRRRRKRAS